MAITTVINKEEKTVSLVEEKVLEKKSYNEYLMKMFGEIKFPPLIIFNVVQYKGLKLHFVIQDLQTISIFTRCPYLNINSVWEFNVYNKSSVDLCFYPTGLEEDVELTEESAGITYFDKSVLFPFLPEDELSYYFGVSFKINKEGFLDNIHGVNPNDLNIPSEHVNLTYFVAFDGSECYHPMLSNVYGDGHVCLGEDFSDEHKHFRQAQERGEISLIKQFYKYWENFNKSRFNGHLFERKCRNWSLDLNFNRLGPQLLANHNRNIISSSAFQAISKIHNYELNT